MDVYADLRLTEPLISNFAEEAKDWACTHGIVMRNRKNLELMNHAPFMLFPSPYPRYLYEEACIVQKDFQRLLFKASLDHEFIESALRSVIIHDEFTRRQYEIYDAVRKEGFKHKSWLYLTRSDYMIDVNREAAANGLNGMNGHVEVNGHVDEVSPQKRLYENKQIEINMIAASFAGLNTHTCQMHRYMADALGELSPYDKDKLPENRAIYNLGDGLAKGWAIYGKENAVVVFVVMEGEKNRFDQRLLEYSFHENTRAMGVKKFIPVLFRTLAEISQGHLDQDSNLIVEGREVAIVYFRAGYSPSCYVSEESWTGRLLAERSTAIKVPDMASNLVGTKKVQQVLAVPGMVERFIEDDDSVKRIRRTFAGLYSLDPGPDGDEAANMALAAPERFVMKPQREGGGNNLYDDDLAAALRKMTDPEERSQFILMERLRPPTVRNYIVHVDLSEPRFCDVVSELGIFGYFISDGRKELANVTAGHLLRTKSIEHNDGGVAAGRAVLDTPYLI